MPQLHTTRSRRVNQARHLGNIGEELTARHYRNAGYQLLGRNVHFRVGELDLVAQSPDGTITFIEVKTRTTSRFGVAESVTPAKFRRIRRAAYCWLQAHHHQGDVRFDVVTVYLNEDSTPQIRQYIGVDHGAR